VFAVTRVCYLGFLSLRFTITGLNNVSSRLVSSHFILRPFIDKAYEAQGDTPLYDHVQSIGYLDQVVCEVLRLCAPAFNLLRGCGEEVAYKGIRFPKGVDVNIPNYVLYRDPEILDNPLEFNPESFSRRQKRSGIRTPLSRLVQARASVLECD